jgi:hypothetical protein
MAEIVIKTQGQMAKDRIGRVRSMQKVTYVRVVPEEKYRKVLKHLPSGIGFSAEGHANWPFDNFTKRRLREGAVKFAEGQERPVPRGPHDETQSGYQPQQQPPPPQGRARQRAE